MTDHSPIKNLESYIQKIIAIGGRANGAINYIEKGQYQKAKHYMNEILKIAEKEILKWKGEHR